MRIITDKELLQLQLDILRDVDSFCRKNEIEYFLVGGTGIGAVRHGGYIPWDDDIDLGMTRPNYDKFLKLFNGSFPNLKLYAPEIDLDYYAPYANVCDTRTILDEGVNGHRHFEIGVKIDIFPYDGVPSPQDGFENIRSKAVRLMNNAFIKRCVLHKMKISMSTSYILFVINKILLSFQSYSSIQKKIMDLGKLVPYEKAEYLEKIVFPYHNNQPCRKEVFEEYRDMQFENLIVRNLVDYDFYLKSVFGDYMQLPPEEKRRPRHGFTAYWKND